MFGGRAFGSTYFAQAGGVPVPAPPSTAFSPGGSGFPKDWFERMRPDSPEMLELADLIAVGVV